MAKDITTPAGKGKVSTSKKTSAKDRKKTTNDNKEVSNLEQFILTQNIDKVNNYYLSHKELFNYKTFRQINGNGTQLVNKLRGIDNVDVFYKMKTSTLSLMQPKIRVFKVNYEEFITNEDGTPDDGKIVALRTPCYKEFRFSDNFGQETAATVQDYLAYESTKPSWRNIGLNSFKVHQNGETHGIIENNIKCTLSLTFKSLKDIQASPPGEPHHSKGGLRYSDLITWAPARIDRETETYNPKHYEIKAIIGYTAPSLDQLEGMSLSRQDIRNISNIEKMNTIVALCLLDYDIKIKENGQVDLTATYRGRIETVVGSNQVNIFQNTFRITQGGNVSVSKRVDANHNISRVSRMIAQIGSIHRELKKPSCKDEKCKSREKARKLFKEDKFFLDVVLKELGTKNQNTSDEAVFEWFRNTNNIDRAIAVIKKKIGAYKKDVYKSFMDQVITGNDESKDAYGTRLFCVNAGADAVTNSMGIIFDDKPVGPGITEPDETNNIEEEENASSQTTAIAKGALNDVKIDRCHKVAPIDANIANNAAQEIVTAIDGESESKDEKKGGDKKDKARKSVLVSGGKDYRFYFVYLGDVLELACKNSGMGVIDFDPEEFLEALGTQGQQSVFRNDSYFPEDSSNVSLDYPLKNARILLGPLEYFDSKGDIKKINLAQFPISFNYFRAWFLNKVVRRKRAQMPLGSFIVSLINNLVIPALGVGMPKSAQVGRTRSHMVALTLPGKQVDFGSADNLVCGRQVGNIEEMLPKQRVINIDSADFKQNYLERATKPISSETMIKTSYDYLLIHITTAKDIISRRADPIEDVQDGIYHFNIGSDMGLLKSMTFTRVKIPFLTELRSEQAEAQGADQLEQLKLPYNTNLNLIGTSLFTPGMYYYVNPSLAGLGSVEDAASLAYKMNLGGYHLIGQVETTITPGKYETKITGRQTAQGRR
jgi:hypothetical protein